MPTRPVINPRLLWFGVVILATAGCAALCLSPQLLPAAGGFLLGLALHVARVADEHSAAVRHQLTAIRHRAQRKRRQRRSGRWPENDEGSDG